MQKNHTNHESLLSLKGRLIGVTIPYAAVAFGLYVLHSAWASILLYHILIIFFLLSNKKSVHVSRMFAGLDKYSMIPGLLVYALAGPVLYILWPFVNTGNGVLSEWLTQYHLTGLRWLFFLPYFSVVHPLLEEIHWRTLEDQISGPISWMDLGFAGYHVLILFFLLHPVWIVLVVLILSVSSSFWRFLARRNGGFAVPILTHAVADTSVILFTHLLLKN